MSMQCKSDILTFEAYFLFIWTLTIFDTLNWIKWLLFYIYICMWYYLFIYIVKNTHTDTHLDTPTILWIHLDSEIDTHLDIHRNVRSLLESSIQKIQWTLYHELIEIVLPINKRRTMMLICKWRLFRYCLNI